VVENSTLDGVEHLHCIPSIKGHCKEQKPVLQAVTILFAMESEKKMAPKVAASYQYDDQYFAVIDSYCQWFFLSKSNINMLHETSFTLFCLLCFSIICFFVFSQVRCHNLCI